MEPLNGWDLRNFRDKSGQKHLFPAFFLRFRTIMTYLIWAKLFFGFQYRTVQRSRRNTPFQTLRGNLHPCLVPQAGFNKCIVQRCTALYQQGLDTCLVQVGQYGGNVAIFINAGRHASVFQMRRWRQKAVAVNGYTQGMSAGPVPCRQCWIVP